MTYDIDSPTNVLLSSVDELTLPPDLVIEPSRVATTWFRVVARRPSGAVMLEPLLELIEMLPRDSTVGSVTLRVSARGPADDRKIDLSLGLSVLGDEGARGEVDQLARHIATTFESAHSLFRLAPVRHDDSPPWPTTGTVTLIRQPSIDTSCGSLPLRYNANSPAGRERLVRALLASTDSIDVIVTLQPTSVRSDEREQLEEIRNRLCDLRDRPGQPGPQTLDGQPLERLISSATDALASYRTATWIAQVAIVEAHDRNEATRRAIGRAIGGGFDTIDGGGARQVAVPSHFLSGGYDLIPARHSDRLLATARNGQLAIHEHRELVDVVTAAELRSLLIWPTGSEEPIPGIPDGDPRPPHEAQPGDIILGNDSQDRGLSITWQTATQHVLHVGTTGSGKSASLHNVACQALDANDGLFVFDSNDDLLRLVASAAMARCRDVVILDAASGALDSTNLVAHEDPTTIDDRVYAVIEGLTSGLPLEMYGPMGRTYLEGAARIAARLGLPFDTILRYGTEPTLARRHADELGEVWAQRFADSLVSRKQSDTAELIGWVESKLGVLHRSHTSNTFMATDPSVDLFASLDAGTVVLVNPGSDGSQSKLTANMVLAVLDRWARTRTASSRRTVAIVDEAHNVAGPLVERALAEWRKRAISIHLASTTLSLLGETGESAVANTSTVLIMRSRGRTAHVLADLFGLDPQRLASLANLTAYVAGGELPEPTLVSIPSRPPTPDAYPAQVLEAIHDRKRKLLRRR